MTDRSYVVIPFGRNGAKVGPCQALVFGAAGEARAVAQHLAPRFTGVAILECRVDPETGGETESVIAEIGAVPPRHPGNWSASLN